MTGPAAWEICRGMDPVSGTGSALRPSWCALLRLVRVPPVPGLDRAFLDALADPALQDELHALATRHGVLGTVLAALERGLAAPGMPAPPAALGRLLAPLPVLHRQAAVWELERDRVVTLFRGAGLAPVVLKGAALRVLAYDAPVERSLGDLDLLLPDQEVDRAVALLEGQGYSLGDERVARLYRERHFHYRLANRSGFQVEVHWDLLPPDAPFRLSAERMRTRARTVERAGGPPLAVPAPEDMLLHLASQQIEDSVTTLRRVVDMDRLVRSAPGLDWGLLRDAAREDGLTTVLALSLQLARRLLATPLPPDAPLGGAVPAPVRMHLALLDPVVSLLDQYPRRRAAAARYVGLWLAAEPAIRRRRLGELLAGRGDHHLVLTEPGARRDGPVRGAVGAAKLASFWAWLYLRGALRLTRRMGGAARGFWAS